jgi:hypothetical protein
MHLQLSNRTSRSHSQRMRSSSTLCSSFCSVRSCENIVFQRESARDGLHADLVTVRKLNFSFGMRVSHNLQVGRPVMQRASGSFVEVSACDLRL